MTLATTSEPQAMTQKPLNILAVGAHPDDLELLCAGTLARYRQAGHTVTLCTIARGDRGASHGSRDELAAVRSREAKAAAELIGARHFSLEVPDGEVDGSDRDQRRRLTEVIRISAPDLVITHSPDDYMSDHNECSELVFASTFLATLGLFECDGPVLASVPALVYMDTLSGLNFEPDEYVDISSTIDTKVAMMAAHKSQLDWLGSHDEMDAIAQIRTVAAFRGLQSGVAYAEAFRHCRRHLRMRTYRLLP